jgi:hypothetical protein
MTMALARSASGATPTRPSLTGRAAIVAAVGVPCSALILIAGTPQNVVLADQVRRRSGATLWETNESSHGAKASDRRKIVATQTP